MAKSIRLSRYFAGNLAVAVAPLIAACAIGLVLLAGVMRKSLADANAMSAMLAASRLEEFFIRPKEALSLISTMLGNADLYPPGRLEGYLEDVRIQHHFLDRVQIIGSDDRVRAVAPPDPALLGVSRAGEALYERIKASDQPFWSDSYITTAGNVPGLSFGQAARGGTVLCDLNLGWLRDFAASIRTSGIPSIQIRITDRNGVFLSAPDQGSVARRERQAGFSVLRGFARRDALASLEEGGDEWLASYAEVEGPGWFVIVMFPASVLAGSLLGVSALIAALAALGSAVSGLFWRRRLRRIEEVFVAITRQADRVSAGEYEALGDFGGGFLELERVGHSLDAMVGAIGEREAALKTRERGFREILERIDLPAIGVDHDGLLVFANSCFLGLVGKAEGEAIGSPVRDFRADADAACPFDLALRGEQMPSLVVCSVKSPDGGAREVHWSIVAGRGEDRAVSGLIAIGHDMTEILEQRLGLELSLREKEILLREVHHRVKNNLQVITSLLSIQGSESGEGAVRDALAEARGRIQTIALVHETLYGSADIEDLDFGPYAEELARLIMSESAKEGIELACACGPLRLDLEESIPCGLILTEALINVQKHAFPPDWPGQRRVRLEVETAADGTARLAVRDSGAGISARAERSDRQGMGREIIGALAEQLNGSLRTSEDGGGTSVELTFRPKSAGK
jgi:PAS domain S-box-containing protein